MTFEWMNWNNCSMLIEDERYRSNYYNNSEKSTFIESEKPKMNTHWNTNSDSKQQKYLVFYLKNDDSKAIFKDMHRSSPILIHDAVESLDSS